MIYTHKTFIISTILIIINGIYGNLYSIIKYIFYINIGYVTFKYIYPYIITKRLKDNIETKKKYIIKKMSDESKEDNSIFLTQFRVTGIHLYIYHFMFGYYSYFFDFINLFCLTISFLQIYDYNDFRSFIPLLIFSTMYTLYYVYTVSKLIGEQNRINDSLFQNNKLKNIKRGNVINIYPDDIIPADILILTDNQHVTVNELELTGENVMVNKQAVFENCKISQLLNSKIYINHKKNNGYIKMKIDNNIKKYNYDNNNIIFRGTKMVDGWTKLNDNDTIWQGNLKGLVIETGNDCMIYNIDNTIVKEKTWLYKKVNNITFDNLYYLLTIASILSGALKYIYPDYKFINLMKTVILLLNTVVPLSLQSFYNAGTWILSKKIEKENNIKINSHGTHVFQNDPKYVVTDKTGTLTKNKLKLAQVINVIDYNNNVKCEDITKKPSVNNFNDIMSCSLINAHSDTEELLNNDEMEYLLLNWTMKKNNIKLISNSYNEHNKKTSKYEYNIENQIYLVKKLLYQKFDYKYGIKYSIIKYKTNEGNYNYYLHVQGTPEAINDYSKNKNLVIEGEKLMHTMKDNCYRRIICHASKFITTEEYNIIKKNNEAINTYLENFEYVNIYVFEDELINNLKECFDTIINNEKNITILTGDRLSSSIEVSKILGIYNKPYHIDNITDIEDFYLNNYECVLINGRIFNELIFNSNDELTHIIKNINKIIIYRATPETKEKYIEYIKSIDSKNQVMMIGDGSNDIAAIMKSDIGVGIIGESNQVQNISDIILDSWDQIPDMLNNFVEKKNIIEHNIKWVLAKHIMTASILLTLMLVTSFKELKDPANPYYMLLFNCGLFIYMGLFCININYRLLSNPINQNGYNRWIYYSFIKGIGIGSFVFTVFDPEFGMKIALILELIYLLINL